MIEILPWKEKIEAKRAKAIKNNVDINESIEDDLMNDNAIVVTRVTLRLLS